MTTFCIAVYQSNPRTLNRLGDSSVPFPNSPSTPDCIPAFYSFIQGASPTGRVLQQFHYVRVQKSQLCIPRKGNALPQSQFPHSCVCERFIYSQDRSTYFPAQEYAADRLWENKIRSQTYEYWNWDRVCAIPFLGIFVSNFRYCVFAMYAEIEPRTVKFDMHCNI